MKKLAAALFLIALAITAGAQDNKINTLQGLESGTAARQNNEQIGILKSASRLFGAKDDLTSVIFIVPAGDTVLVTGSDSTYYHVLYQDTSGYLLRKHLKVQNLPFVSAVQDQQQNIQDAQQNSDQGNRFSYLENKYGTSMAARIIAGKIWKGMTTGMVRDSWGNPGKINRVVESTIIKEEWIYSNSWLFFENDVLIQWGPVR